MALLYLDITPLGISLTELFITVTILLFANTLLRSTMPAHHNTSRYCAHYLTVLGLN